MWSCVRLVYVLFICASLRLNVYMHVCVYLCVFQHVRGSSAGVEGWHVGERVVLHPFLVRGDGTFADYALVDAVAAVRIPESVAFEVRSLSPPCY